MSVFKKIVIVGNLIAKTYASDVSFIRSYSSEDDTQGRMEIIFTNKPDQKVSLLFVGFDTWDKIKKKIQKLIDSDGICVVGCEKQKGRKKLVKQPCKGCPCGHMETVLEIDGKTDICQSCCEYICRDCVAKNHDWKCMVCRQCIIQYYHLMDKEECTHANLNRTGH